MLNVAKNPQNHFLYLDFLRGVASIAVLLLHWMDGNGVKLFGSSLLAVDFFFMLSGFVISLSYGERLRNGYPILQFMLKRLVRLYPLVFVGILLGAARFMLRDYLEIGQFITADTSTSLLLGLFLIPSNIGGGVVAFFPLNTPIWSLFFEIIAYSIFGIAAYRLANRSIVVIQSILLLGIVSWVFANFGENPTWWLVSSDMPEGVIYGLSRVGFGFLAGVLIHRHIDLLAMKDRPFLRWFLLTLFLTVLTLPRTEFSPWLALLSITVIFPLIISNGLSVSLSPTEEKIGRFFGDLSYPLYVIHVPIIWTLGAMMKSMESTYEFDSVWNGIIILPATIFAAILLFHLYDKSVRKILNTMISVRYSKVKTS